MARFEKKRHHQEAEERRQAQERSEIQKRNFKVIALILAVVLLIVAVYLYTNRAKGPLASFTVDGNEKLVVEKVASSKDLKIESHSKRFNDLEWQITNEKIAFDTIINNVNPLLMVFEKEGTYRVILKVTNEENDAHQVEKVLQIKSPTETEYGSNSNGSIDEEGKEETLPDEPEGPIAETREEDRDGDGVLDATDDCPDSPGEVRMQGCPDSDGDGIIDKEDKCPNDKGSQINKGCPERSGKKIEDQNATQNKPVKQPPKIPSPSQQEDLPKEEEKEKAKGDEVRAIDEPDTDGDGLADKDDKCPKQSGPKSNKGCPQSASTAEKITLSKDINQIISIAEKEDVSKAEKYVVNELLPKFGSNPKYLIEDASGRRGQGDTGLKGYLTDLIFLGTEVKILTMKKDRDGKIIDVIIKELQ